MTRNIYQAIICSTAIVLLSSCKSQRHMVLASTGTVIGVELSQNPGTQAPQGTLGYNRAELAIVPSNRSTLDDPGTTGKGAADVPDVLMEMRYTGIFNWGEKSGIYQRLAIGATAVSQPGASLMFARSSDGSMEQDTAKAIQSLHAEAADRKSKQDDAAKTFADVVFSEGKLDEDKLNTLLDKGSELFPSIFTDSIKSEIFNTAKDEGQDELLSELKEMPPNIPIALDATHRELMKGE